MVYVFNQLGLNVRDVVVWLFDMKVCILFKNQNKHLLLEVVVK